MEITISGSSSVYETDYVEEDYQLPNQTEIEYDVDMNPITPLPFPTPLKYTHNYSYTYKAVGPFYIKAIYMHHAAVFPANETYPTSSGTRNITLLDQYKNSVNSGNTATLTWNYGVHYIYTKAGISKTFQRNRSHQKMVPF